MSSMLICNFLKFVLIKKQWCDLWCLSLNFDSACLKIIPACVDLVRKSERYDRSVETDINIMVVGVPNVGKSTLLNNLRELHGLKAVAGVDSTPGYTKYVGFKTRVR